MYNCRYLCRYRHNTKCFKNLVAKLAYICDSQLDKRNIRSQIDSVIKTNDITVDGDNESKHNMKCYSVQLRPKRFHKSYTSTSNTISPISKE